MTMLTPLKPKTFPLLNPASKLLPLVYHGANVFNLCPFPDSPTLYVQHLFPIGPAVCELFLAYAHSQMNPQTCTEFGANRSIRLAAFPDLHLWPPKTPQMTLGSVGRLVFSLCPFPDESADVNQSWCQSVQPFDSFSILLNVWPPKNSKCPPWRAICLAYIHSQMNLHMCTKFGANRSSCLTASTYFWICDPPLNTPKCPLGYWGANSI